MKSTILPRRLRWDTGGATQRGGSGHSGASLAPPTREYSGSGRRVVSRIIPWRHAPARSGATFVAGTSPRLPNAARIVSDT